MKTTKMVLDTRGNDVRDNNQVTACQISCQSCQKQGRCSKMDYHQHGVDVRAGRTRYFYSRSCAMLLLVFLLYNGLLAVGVSGTDAPRQCEEITLPMCRNIGYNLTHMPNQFNMETQMDAGLVVNQFMSLVEIRCSPDLRFFLCSMYVPICMTNYHKPLPPCRSVCERAKAGCEPLMGQYGFKWPQWLPCDTLPEYGDKDQLCMDFNTTERAGNPPPTSLTKRPKVAGTETSTPKDCDCKCRHPLVSITNQTNPLYNKITTGGQINCVMNCEGAYFSTDQKTFAQFWIGLWAVLCCVSTAMTICTFFVDMQRLKYPERPIVFLSGCYLMVSIGFIIRLVVGHDAVACDMYEDNPIIRYETTGPAVCTVVFLLIYFFGMASSIWWVVLSFTWFLAAGLKWGQEAIAKYSQYFHLAAWLIPSVKSIAVLALSSVDGDPIAGVCYVGNQNLNNLRGFVLAPLCAYLVLGTSFLLAGFISLFRIRSVIKQQGHAKAEKLEKLMIRIGMFTVLYTVPATIVIGCYFYEQHFRERWEETYNCPCLQEKHTPNYLVFMLKYFMCLVVGVTSGFWIWSGKTLDSWRRFYVRLCRKPQYHRPGGAASSSKLTSASAATAVVPGYQGNKQIPMSQV